MEQARYWMWRRTSSYSNSRPHLSFQIPRLFVGSPYSQSWEERAFAEDTAGHLGGCIWPPRSYSCSFCRREFRSAQALGGHMNVHRRDRARLKQQSSSLGHDEASEDDVPQHPNPCMVMGMECQPQVSHIVFGAAANPNPNDSGVLSPPVPPPRVSSALSTQENWTEKILLSTPFSSSITTKSLQDSTPLHLLVPEMKILGENLGSTNKEFGLLRWRDDGVFDEESNCNKRRRRDTTPAFFVHQQDRSDEVLNKNNPVEELDLELRLGDAPKIK